MKSFFLFLFFFLQFFLARSQSRFADIDSFIMDYFEKFIAEKIDSIHVYNNLDEKNRNFHVFKYNSEGKIIEHRRTYKNNLLRLVEFSYEGRKSCRNDSIYPLEGTCSHQYIVSMSEFYGLFGRIERVEIETNEKDESKEFTINFIYNNKNFRLLDSLVFKGFTILNESYVVIYYGIDMQNDRLKNRFFFYH